MAIATIKTVEAYKAALKFSAILAADKGVGSTVKKLNRKGDYRVTADDGKYVDFLQQ